jgi:elongation factor Ts
MASSAEMVKELRDRTGAGVMDCKAALEASAGDVQGAIEHLRKKGLADAAKKAHRDARDGVVASYIHSGGKIGVLVEVNCETDFVARTDDFQQLVKDVAMQVAAANPLYVAREHVPGSMVEKEREIYREQMADQKKPAQVLDKIIEGKLEKFYMETCLLEQPFIKDSSGKTKMKDLVDQATAKLGERVLVKRFARFQVGEA